MLTRQMLQHQSAMHH